MDNANAIKNIRTGLHQNNVTQTLISPSIDLTKAMLQYNQCLLQNTISADLQHSLFTINVSTFNLSYSYGYIVQIHFTIR